MTEMPPDRRKELADEPFPIRQRVRCVLNEVLPLCRDLTAEEMGWVTGYCLKYLCLKIGEERDLHQGAKNADAQPTEES